MKFRYPSLLALLLPLWAALGAQSVTFDPLSATGAVGDTVVSTVRVTDFSNPISFQFQVSWDTARVAFVNVRNLNPSLVGNNDFQIELSSAVNGRIRVTYVQFASPAPALPNPSDLFALAFRLKAAGTTTIAVVDPPNFPALFAGNGSNSEDPITITGAFTVNVTGGGTGPGGGSMGPCAGLTAPTIVFGDTVTTAGDSVCIPVYGFALDSVNSFQFRLRLDTSLLRNGRVRNVLPVIAPDLIFGNRTVVYNNGGGVNVHIPDCSLLFEACFDTNPGAGGVTGVGFEPGPPTAPEFIDFPSGPFNVVADTGVVRVLPSTTGAGVCDGLVGPTVFFADTTVVTGGSVCVPLYAFGIPALNSFNFELDYDRSVLRFDSFTAVLPVLTNGFLADVTAGSALYSSPTGNDVALTDCIQLLQACFTAIGANGDSTEVDFATVPAFDFADLNGTIPVANPPGTVVVADTTSGPTTPCDDATGPSLVFGDGSGLVGDTICVPVYGYQISPITSFEFTINYDASAFTLLRLDSINPQLAAGLQLNPTNGKVLFSETMGVDLTFADCERLFDVCLVATGPDSVRTRIGIDTTLLREFASVGGPFAVGNVDGTLEIRLDSSFCARFTEPTIGLTEGRGAIGDTVCVNLVAYDLLALEFFDFDLQANGAFVELIDTQAVDPRVRAGLVFAKASGTLTYNSPNPNGTNFSGCDTLLQVCYRLIDGAGDSTAVSIAGTPAFRDTAGVITPALVPGEIKIDSIGGPCDDFVGPTLEIGMATAAVGDTVCVPVIGSQLGNVVTFQFGIDFDTARLNFVRLENALAILPGLQTSIFGGDQLRILFEDRSAVGVDLNACDTLFEACFAVRSGAGTTVSLDFDRGFNEVAALDSTVIVTANNGSIEIEAGASCDPIVITETLVQPRCNGESNGSISLAVSGGDGSFTYSWSDGGVTTRDRTGLAAGTYTVTVTSCLGAAMQTRTFTLVAPDALNATGVVTQPGCAGANTGAIDLSVVGGTPGYTYLWSGPGVNPTAQDQSGLGAGTYSVSVTDSRGCTDTESFTLVSAGAITISGAVTDVACNGQANGAIDITVAGGTAPYTFAWTGTGVAPTAEDQTGLAAGTYSVTVTDANNCTESASFTVGQPAALAAAGVLTQPTCASAMGGAIDLTVSGGTQPYSYAWTGPGVNPAAQDQTGLGAGTYAVTVTDTRGCTANASFTLVAPATVSVTGQVTPAGCSGGNDGAIALTVTGGLAPYNYDWTGAGTVDGQRDQSGLAPGSYSVTVTDANQCSATQAFTVGSAATIMIQATVVQPSSGGTNDGSIDITPSGGDGNYAYSWTGPGVVFDNQDQFGLGAGTYTVTVTDGAGCSAMRQFVLMVGAPTVTAVATASCNNASTGTITVTVAGGTAPFDYSWTGGLSAMQNQTGVAPGTYTVTVTDANSLVGSATVTVGTLPAIRLSADITPANNGNDGAINLTVSGGGGGPFDFSWSNGATTEDLSGLAAGQYTVRVTDQATGCTTIGTYDVPTGLQPLQVVTTFRSVRCNSSSGGTCDGEYTVDVQQGVYPVMVTFTGGAASVGLPATATITGPGLRTFPGLCPGTFDARLVDGAGATFSDFGVEIVEPAQIQITSVTIIPVVGDGAANGGVDITVAGGTQPYTFAWTAGPNPTTEDNLGLATGTYAVVITDANGCVFRSSNYEVRQFRINRAEVTDVACSGDATGEINIEATGGNGRYTYLWSNGATTQDIIGLRPGVYTVTVTDVASGVSFTASYEVESTSTLAISAQVISFYNGFEVSCAGGSDGQATAMVTGADGDPQITWSNGATGATITGLAAGVYTATARDASGCTVTSRPIEVEDAPAILADLRVDNVRCRGEDNGRIVANVTGGASGYSYLWSDGSTERSALRLTAGEYTLNVTDRNGCEVMFTAGVTEPTANLNVVPMVTGATAVRAGRIDLTITGQTPPYRITWEDRSETGPVLEGLAAGTYTVTIADANNCEMITLDIDVPNGDFACYDASDVITPGVQDGLNDLFVINCIEAQTQNEVQIFNRWGQVVYEATGYNNRTVVFDGRNSSGELLPEGGYFYVLQYRDAQDVEQVARGSFNLVR